MKTPHSSFWLITAAALIFGNGCQKSESNSSPPLPLSKDTIVRAHWIGKGRLSIDAGAYFLMRIWELPVSEQLERQTINKLSAAPSFLVSSSGQRPADADRLATTLFRD